MPKSIIPSLSAKVSSLLVKSTIKLDKFIDYPHKILDEELIKSNYVKIKMGLEFLKSKLNLLFGHY